MVKRELAQRRTPRRSERADVHDKRSVGVMDMLEAFWYFVILSSVGWYGFLVFYVGYKGFFDIISMAKALNQHHAANAQKTGTEL
jgi:hypothetical protein